MSELTWADDVPGGTGWYWVRGCEDEPERGARIVQVFDEPTAPGPMLYAEGKYLVQDYWADPSVKWAGPIGMPNEPVSE